MSLGADMLDPAGLARHLGVSRSQLYTMLSAGRIPQPLRLSERVVRWPAAWIHEWISAGCPSDWQPRTAKAR